MRQHYPQPTMVDLQSSTEQWDEAVVVERHLNKVHQWVIWWTPFLGGRLGEIYCIMGLHLLRGGVSLTPSLPTSLYKTHTFTKYEWLVMRRPTARYKSHRVNTVLNSPWKKGMWSRGKWFPQGGCTCWIITLKNTTIHLPNTIAVRRRRRWWVSSAASTLTLGNHC